MDLRTASGRTDETGAAAVTFMVSFLALLSLALLAVDGGSLYLSQRGQVADTDAAALAVAQLLTENPCTPDADIQAEAAEYVTAKNDAATSPTLVDVPKGAFGCATGRVTVATTRDATLFFGPIFGFDDLPTSVTSEAQFGPAAALTNLRPFGFCAADPHYMLEWQPYFAEQHHGGPAYDPVVGQLAAESLYAAKYPGVIAHPTARGVLANGAPYHPSADVHRFVTGRDDTTWCPGGRSGNFGWFDFDPEPHDVHDHDCGEVPGSQELLCDTATGYKGHVSINPRDCRPEDGSATSCGAQTGSVASIRAALETLRCPASLPASHADCETIYVVVYSSASTGGPGGGATYDLTSVAGVVIRDYLATGPPDRHYIDMEFVDELTIGEVGPPVNSGTAPSVVGLCGTGTFSNC